MPLPRFLTVLNANALVIWTWVVAVGLVHVVQYGTGAGQPSLGLALSTAAIPAALVAIAPPRARRWTMLVVVVLLAVLAMANAAYHRFFGAYIPLAMFGAGTYANDLGGYVTGLLRTAEVAPTALLLVVSGVLFMRAHAATTLGRVWHTALPLGLCLLGSGPAVRWAWVVSPGSPDSSSGGFLYTELVDFRRLIGERMMDTEPPADDLDRVLRFAEQVARDSARRDLWYGSAAGSNVVMIQVEALNQWVLDATVEGQPVTPYLHSLADRGLTFTEIFDATGRGRSSDADYMVMASQHPLEHDAVAMVRPNLDLDALPEILIQRGYAAFSAHGTPSVHWNAVARNRRYGFPKALFAADFGDSERLGFGLLDGVFLKRVAPMVVGLPRPFIAWFTTASMHGPHRQIPAALRTMPLGRLDGTPVGIYLQKARHTDDAIHALIASLDSAGVLAHTTILVYGDHTENYEFDMSEVRRLAQLGNLPEDETHLLLDRVPLIIVPPGRGAPALVPTVGSLMDVAPTVLHLLGLSTPRSYLGRSLLPYAPSFAAQVSGESVTDDRMWSGAACYSRPALSRRPSSDCDELRVRARRQLEVSWLITRYNLAARLDGRGAR